MATRRANATKRARANLIVACVYCSANAQFRRGPGDLHNRKAIRLSLAEVRFSTWTRLREKSSTKFPKKSCPTVPRCCQMIDKMIAQIWSWQNRRRYIFSTIFPVILLTVIQTVFRGAYTIFSATNVTVPNVNLAPPQKSQSSNHATMSRDNVISMYVRRTRRELRRVEWYLVEE